MELEKQVELKRQGTNKGETEDAAIRRKLQYRYLVAVPRISKGGEGGGTEKVAVRIIAVHDKTAFSEAMETYNIGLPSNEDDANNPNGLGASVGFFAFPSKEIKDTAEHKVEQARKVRELKAAMDELKQKLGSLDEIGAGGVLAANAPHGTDSDSDASKAAKIASREIDELLTTFTPALDTGAVRRLLYHAARIERQSCEMSIIGTNVQKPDFDWRHALQKDHSDRQKLTCVVIRMINDSTNGCGPLLF